MKRFLILFFVLLATPATALPSSSECADVGCIMSGQGQLLLRPTPVGKTHVREVLGRGTILSHPSGCPRRLFCGCGASVEAFGRSVRSLWTAASWGMFKSASPAPRMAAFRRHHVVILRHHISGSIWMVYDANSGGRQTRIHPRNISGMRVVDPYSRSVS